MKNFKFAKAENVSKDTNWFKKIEEVKSTIQPPKELKIGLSPSDEKKIHKEMIPMFIKTQRELEPQYEKIKTVGRELETIR